MKDRILVVDDDAQLLKAISNALEAMGYAVRTAGSGEAALSLLATEEADLDLLLLDLDLPGIGGQEVIERLRSWSKLPVLVLSVMSGQDDKVAALDAGADDYVTKPFGMKELIARMRAVSRRVGTEEKGPPILRFRGLEIDLARHLVTMEGERLHLTGTEYRLLEAMAGNPGSLLTRQWLLRTVWGRGYENESNYVRLYVKQLRRKLNDDPSDPRWIATELGLGYRWLPEPLD